MAEALLRIAPQPRPVRRTRANTRHLQIQKGGTRACYSSLLAVAGSLCLTITLVLAWCLVGVRSSAFMKKVFPSYQQLLKAHMDYLLVTGLLMIFYLLFAHFRVLVSPLILISMSVGSLMNPVGFLALAIKPDIRQHPASVFGGLMAGSFTLTTIGYAGAAWSVAHAAVLSL